MILEKLLSFYNNSSSMHGYTLIVCYLVTVFFMLVIITPDLPLCNSELYPCSYVIFRKYPVINIWCVCVRACALSGAIAPYSTEQ